MSDQDKLNDEELQNCFRNVSTQMKVALAVSGGPDSMALLLLADRWRRRRLEQGRVAPDITVFAVDHGLRAQAGEECQFVINKAKELGYQAHILHWEGPALRTRIQELAREIRYQLLVSACHLHGIKTLMTAHHLDDQAETFLMRLARGSGVDGLAAMAPQSRRYGLTLLRPLLKYEKATLLEQLRIAGWGFIADPSNEDSRFERVRLRRRKQELKKIGLTSSMIGLAASRSLRAKTALDEVRDQFLAKNALFSTYGTARIDQLALSDAPDEIAIRALSKVLRICGGSQEQPNMARIEKLHLKLKEDFSTNRTLAGCRLIAKGEFWLIVREVGRILEVEKPVEPGACIFWDARYIVCADKAASNKIVVGPLGKPAELKKRVDPKALQNLPKEALSSLLTLRHKGQIIAVPVVDFWTEKATRAGLDVRFIAHDDGLV